ncbi:MAG TPA: diguanylate cyclase [Spirochaetota bacterium]|nr:diguanylate cyclase [Spirochaetota bacterium]HPI90512.1 diguanylate cyclase [Spirochaetota bacterium]HPR46950.1 diguanylate cyclase [Spirochaetota bacterium]
MKVHLIDNTKKLFSAIDRSLKAMDMSTTVSMTDDEAVDSIHQQSPSIVIINWSSSQSDIENLCKKIRKIKSENYIYILLLAPQEKEKDIAVLLKSGVNDYLFKPVKKDDLALRIKIAQRIIKLEESVQKSRKKLIKFAKEDPHTGLLNRRALLDEALREMGRASREKKNLSAIMVGATNFKRIVATYGSEMGDDVLLEISRRLKLKCRPYDMAGRYTVTDFLVFLPDTGLKNADKVAQRILSSIADKPFVLRGRKLNVSVSIGVSELNYHDVVENNNVDAHLFNDLLLDALVKRSEVAMDKAGKGGRNSIVVNE